MRETIEYLNTFAHFPVALRRFLRDPLPPEAAPALLRERLAQREPRFLRMAERSIYDHPASPYLALLRAAGCELGDLRTLVAQQGIEGAMKTLRDSGVYVTFEEFKGRKPVERLGLSLPVQARHFDNPAARHDFTIQTGGSTGLAVAVGQDLDHIADGAPHQVVALDANGVLGLPALFWMDFLPGGGLRFLLQRARFGQRNVAWFSPRGWRDSRYWLKYGAATLYMVGWARALGAPVPLPQVVRLDEALTVAQAARRLLDREGRCLLYMSTSRAVRVSLAAESAGFDLAGATVRVGGEPVTPAKVATIARSGLRVIPSFGTVETGTIGFGCAHPTAHDDVHLLHDAFALITHPHAQEGFDTTVAAFHLTTLLASAPKVMFNLQTDDYGRVETRRCGCLLGEQGYTTHLQGIRSYSKLVGEAVTLIGNDMVRIVEELLPGKFGGTPLDYQWKEEEEEAHGFTRLILVIAPHIAISDEAAVVESVLEAMRDTSPMADAARSVWKHAHTLRIRRAPPALTRGGKMMPLDLSRRSSSETHKGETHD